MKQALHDFIIRTIPQQMEEEPETGWRRMILYFGPTSYLEELCVHTGLLSGHVMPHPPHSHEHEELHIALSDNFEFVGIKSKTEVEYTEPFERNSLFFHDSRILHSFRNNGSHPAAYFHVRWKKTAIACPPELEKHKFYYVPHRKSENFKKLPHGSSEIVEIYSGPTRYLPRLRVLYTKVLPGNMIPSHSHAHEVIFVIIHGSVEILGRKLDTPSFAFIGSHVPHYIFNSGTEPAEFYAIEFHGSV